MSIVAQLANQLWFSCILVLLTFIANASDRASAATISPLVNPGAESGLAPWVLDDFFTGSTLSVQSGPVSIAGVGTVQATEGTNWFAVDTTASSFGSFFGGVLEASQTVDVQGLGTLLSIEYGGDSFAMGEILSGQGVLLMRQVSVLRYRDAANGFLGDDVFATPNTNITNSTAQILSATDTVTPVAGTAFIEVFHSLDIAAFDASGGTDTPTYRVVGGLDNIIMNIQAVPEPSTMAGLLSLGLSACLWKRRRRED
ncbi:MAG: PEP-CTERM sorting domain-containing protein [Planctomycetota bacterium]